MDTAETVFVPRYEWDHWVGVICAPLMLAVCVLLAFKIGPSDPMLLMAFGFSVLCTVAIAFGFIRRIRFGDRIIVDRYLLPSRVFSYGDVVDIGVMSIKMRKGAISLYKMKNSAENWLRIDSRLAVLMIYVLCYAATYAVMRSGRPNMTVKLPFRAVTGHALAQLGRRHGI